MLNDIMVLMAYQNTINIVTLSVSNTNDKIYEANKKEGNTR